jgi:hypothetical protein
LGDFNVHHHLWEELRNAHLYEPAEAQETAQWPIKLLADYDLRMALPKDKLTLQSMSSSNWTRPDNVFCTAHMLDAFISCNTAPRCRTPCTDHVPILSNIDLEIPHTSTTTNQFQIAATNLNTAIKQAIKEKVPKSKQSPYAKHWWT